MKPRFSPSCDRSCVQMADRFASLRYSLKNKLSDRMIKRLLNSVFAKYRDSSVSHRSIICLSLRLRQIIDVLATDKSRYFAQPRSIIANNLTLRDAGKIGQVNGYLKQDNCYATYRSRIEQLIEDSKLPY